MTVTVTGFVMVVVAAAPHVDALSPTAATLPYADPRAPDPPPGAPGASMRSGAAMLEEATLAEGAAVTKTWLNLVECLVSLPVEPVKLPAVVLPAGYSAEGDDGPVGRNEGTPEPEGKSPPVESGEPLWE